MRACVFNGCVRSVLVDCDATSLFICTELATLYIRCLFTVHFRIDQKLYGKINLELFNNICKVCLLDRVDFYVRHV